VGGGHSCCVPADGAPQADRHHDSIAFDPQASLRMRKNAKQLPGGCFAMGTADADANRGDAEGPIRRVHVESFAIMPTTVTNTQFATFVKRTGYRTTAEQAGWSYVFAGFVQPDLAEHVRGSAAEAPWWLGVDGACWRHPEGPGSNITGRSNHPVVHVSRYDALAYCAWVGGRLPAEPEWEYAARGGLDGARYPWGDELNPGGRYACNIWRGRFPDLNTAEDGWRSTCPVDAFPPNGYGLYNTVGNVWEWSGDRWSAETSDEVYAMRGGSYLCHASYCNRYRVAARTRNEASSSAGNLGFRVAFDAAR